MGSCLALALLASTVLPALQQQEQQQPPPKKQPGEEWLEASPRHHEWIDVKHEKRTVRCFVAYPEVKEKAQAVIVIHENKGLNPWACSVADRLAEAGCIAIAPDLLSGEGPKGGNSDSFTGMVVATKAINALDPAQVLADLDAVVDHARTLPACNGKVSVAGFCWGGGKAFHFATHREDIAAAYVFYGSAPEEGLAKIQCPVYGFYGENDARITAAVPAVAEAMKKASKIYDPVVYPGAGHGFLREGEDAAARKEDRDAWTEAWKRWKTLLAGS